MRSWRPAWPLPAAGMWSKTTIGSVFTQPGIPSMRAEQRWLAAIVSIAVAARLVAVFILGNAIQGLPGIFDEISYHTLATRILAGHGFTFDRVWWPITAAGTPTAHWSYLYTLWLAAVYAIFGAQPIVARLLQAVLA